MVQRHAAINGQMAADAATPEPDAGTPTTLADAARIVREGLGPGAIAWEREFQTMTGHDGETIYVDTATGEMYGAMPQLHPSDGKPV